MSVIKKQGIYSTLFLYIGLIIGFANSIILFPKIVGAEIYGFTQWLLAITSILVFVGNMGIPNATIRFFPYFKDEEKQHQGYLGFSLLLSLLGASLATFIVLFFQDLVLEHFSNEKSASLVMEYYYLVVPLLIFTLYFEVFRAYSKVLYKASFPIFLDEVVGRLVDTFLLVAYFLDLLSLEWFLILFTAKFLLKLIFLIIYLKKEGQLFLRPQMAMFKSKMFPEMAQYSAFTFLAGIGGKITRKVDILMISSFITLSAAGIYAIFSFVVNVISFPHRGLSAIAPAVVAKAWKENDTATILKIYRKTSLNSLIAGLFVFIVIWANLDNLIGILGEQYAKGKEVAILLGFSKIAMISTGISGAIIINSKHYRFDLLFKISTIFLTVTTNYLLIPPYGIVGAALATLITICIGSFLSFLFILIKVGIQPFSMQTIKAILLALFVLAIHFAMPSFASFFEQTHFVYYLIDGFFRTAIIGGLFLGFMLYFNLSPDITALVSKNVKKIRGKLG